MLNKEQTIGANLRKIRIAKNISLEALGKNLESPVSLQQLYKYETGRNRISATSLVDISRVLNCSIIDLLDGVTTFEQEISSYVESNPQNKEITMAAINLIDVIRNK